jgi:glucose/mannose transport system permease protein
MSAVSLAEDVVPPAAPSPRAVGAQNRARNVKALRFSVLMFFLIVFLLPVYVLIVTSFKSPTEADPSQAWNLPQHWSFQGWRLAWTAIEPGLVNSFKVAVPGALISSVLGSLNGYVLAKWRFPGADVVFTLFLFGMFIPYQAVMIPLVQVLTNLNLSGSLTALMLAHVVYGIPICTLIFRNYYATIPTELIEASRVDGAGMLRTYASVVFPNSAPAFAVVIIWQFTSIWNDFLFAVFLTSPSNWTATVRLNNIAGSMVVSYSQQMSAAILASLPTLLVYVLLGRFFMRGMMAGALKG